MTPWEILVLLLGITLIGFIYWFFFGKKEQFVVAGDVVKLKVQGGYSPSAINVPKNKQLTLLITRTDDNSCLEEIVFPDYKIKKYLPLNEEVEITLNPPHTVSQFHCGMSMYFGKIIPK